MDNQAVETIPQASNTPEAEPPILRTMQHMLTEDQEDDLRNFVDSFVAYSGAEDPEGFLVDYQTGDHTILVSFRPAACDVGKVIGAKGRTAAALRTILQGWGRCWGIYLRTEIVEPPRTDH